MWRLSSRRSGGTWVKFAQELRGSTELLCEEVPLGEVRADQERGAAGALDARVGCRAGARWAADAPVDRGSARAFATLRQEQARSKTAGTWSAAIATWACRERTGASYAKPARSMQCGAWVVRCIGGLQTRRAAVSWRSICKTARACDAAGRDIGERWSLVLRRRAHRGSQGR